MWNKSNVNIFTIWIITKKNSAHSQKEDWTETQKLYNNIQRNVWALFNTLFYED